MCAEDSDTNFSAPQTARKYRSRTPESNSCASLRDKRLNYLFCNRNAPKFMVAIVVSTWGFLINIERSIILPTMFLYFKHTWGEKTADNFYGSTLGVFSFAILIGTPLFGYASYANLSVRYLLLFADFLGVIGNLAYLFASNPWLVFFGRLIAGVGASCESPMYADLSRTADLSERTSYIIVLLLTRQVGLIIGPSFTIVLKHMKFQVGYIEVNVYNGVGLVLSCLWITHMVLIYFFYPKLNKFGALIGEKKKLRAISSTSTLETSDTESIKIGDPMSPEQIPPFEYTFSSFLQYKLVALYATLFAAYYSMMSLEASLSPVADRFFQWNEVEVSYVYIAASVLIIIISVIMNFMSKYFEDRTLILFGLAILTITYAYLAAVVYSLSIMSLNVGPPLLLLGVTFHIIGSPFTLALSESLYSKLVPDEQQDKAQTIVRTIINVSLLIGPFIGGTYQGKPTIVFISMFFMTIVPLLMFVFRFRFFIIPLSVTLLNTNERRPSVASIEDNNNHLRIAYSTPFSILNSLGWSIYNNIAYGNSHHE